MIITMDTFCQQPLIKLFVYQLQLYFVAVSRLREHNEKKLSATRLELVRGLNIDEAFLSVFIAGGCLTVSQKNYIQNVSSTNADKIIFTLTRNCKL